MNEVEKHYGLPDDEDRAGRTGRSGANAAGGLRDKATGTYDQATRWASERYEDASSTLSQARHRSTRELRRSRDSVQHFVEENPIMVGVAALAAGLLIGALLPSTRRENRYFGRYADEFREQGRQYAEGLVQTGKEMVAEKFADLSENLTPPSGQQQSGQVRSNAPAV